MDLDAIRLLVGADLAAVEALLRERLASHVVLVHQLGEYILASGGKRVRPLLTVLAARACGYGGPHHIDLAAVVELIHTATLLHDDVVDASDLRRGRETANQLWGNEATVLVGDFLYSRSFQMMVEVRNLRIMEIMAEATNTIAEGEVLQLMHCHDADTTEERYLEVIRSKTAKLFEAAARLGPVLAERPESEQEALAAYGRHLGTAFQLIDDVLDYTGDVERFGKNVGDDLAEGKPTLPLLYAMWHGTPAARALLRSAIEEGRAEAFREVAEAIRSTGAIDYAAGRARLEAEAAERQLQVLPRSPYRDALAGLATAAVHRVA